MENAPNSTWDDLRVLLALHRHRSFLGAGKALGVSTSTAARRIDALEAALGRTLVHRSSAGTAVEPDALELVALAEQLELGLQAVRRDEATDPLAGAVRISMGEGFVRPVTQLLCDLRRKHPSLRLEIVAEARLSDLARREADIGIRKDKSSSDVLVERVTGRLRFGLYAAPSYVERRLRVARLAADDLARHDFVGFDGPLVRSPQARWLAARGAQHFPFRSNSETAIEEAALQGQGICVLAQAHARNVAGLVELDFDGPLPEPPVYLVFHRELRKVPRCRLVVATLEAALRHALS